VPLLIIVDFGLKPLRPPQDEDLHDLIAERYERASTIVTSNLDFTEWDQPFSDNRLLASASVDRLRHNAYYIELEGPSGRSPKVEYATPINAARSRMARAAATSGRDSPV
jgi:DNA replication protein DnaC